MSQTTPLEIRVHTDLLAAGPAEAWNGLVEASLYPNVFRRWEWLSIWWKWFGKNREVHLLSLTRGGELVGILPLYVSRTHFGGRKLSWIGVGGPTCPEYLGPIIHRDYGEAAVAAITGHFHKTPRTWDSLCFPDVPPDDRITQALIDALEQRYPTIRVPGVVCPCFDLPESFDLLMRRLSHHGRQREKGKLRKARKDFRVELHAVQSAAELHAVFPTLVDMHRSSRALHGESSPFTDHAYAAFHREVIETLLPDGLAKLYLLTFDDKPAAFLYGYVFNGKYYAFQVGFDSGMSNYSPGALVFQLVFEDLIRQGVGEFDFLRGEESYKNAFATGERRTETALVCRCAAPTYAAQWIQSRVVSPVRRRAKQWLVR